MHMFSSSNGNKIDIYPLTAGAVWWTRQSFFADKTRTGAFFLSQSHFRLMVFFDTCLMLVGLGQDVVLCSWGLVLY